MKEELKNNEPVWKRNMQMSLFHKSLLQKFDLDKQILKSYLKRIEIWESYKCDTFTTPPHNEGSLIHLHDSTYTVFTPISENWETYLTTQVEKIALKYKAQDFQHLVKKSKKGKKAKNLHRVLIIQKQIQRLGSEIKKNYDYHLVERVKMLARELQALLTYFYTRQKKFVYFLRRSISKIIFVVRDLRRYFRARVRFLFKDLPDFSGSEEEEVKLSTATNGQLLFLNFQNQRDVLYKVFSRCT